MSSLEKFNQRLQTHQRQLPIIQSRLGRLRLPSLGLRTSERKLLLLTVDALLLNLSLIIALYFFTDLLPAFKITPLAIRWFLTLTILWIAIAAAFDIYNLARAASISYSLAAIIPASTLTTLIYLAIPWLTPTLQRRSQAFAFIILAILATALWRLIYARLFIQPAFQHRALVVGAGQSGHALARALLSHGHDKDANPFRGTGYILLGFLDDDPQRHGHFVEGIPVLGASEHLLHAVRALHIDEIIISITHAHRISADLFNALLSCREIGVPVTAMTTVYERLTGRVAIDHASRNLEIAAGFTDTPFHRFYTIVKRILDFAIALIALIPLLLIIPLVALANRFLSPGPLFFRQNRVGLAGQPYTVIKFRSMVPDAEKHSGPTWACAADHRVTPFGKWLRRTHLDELPQILNVLRGEMSIVGPRPERPEFVEQLTHTIPFYRARHAVRPGITGWAQIHQDYGDSLEGAREKVEYDLYYVKHANPLLDIHIMLRTISKMLTLRGR